MARYVRPATATLVLSAALAAALAAPPVDAQPAARRFPDRPIRFIVPFPGAANDLLARLLGQALTERLGQPVVIDNRGGAGGVLGTALAAKAAPDGHTIVIVPATHAINVSLYAKPPFDAVRDFAPIGLVATAPYMLVAHPSLAAQSVPALIALAKAKPGQLAYGSAGTGNATHLVGELINRVAGIELRHVPYKGVGPALIDTIAGQVQMMIGSVSATQPQAAAGKVRALAVTSRERSPAVPHVPSLHESGLAGFDAQGWWAVLAPARAPAAALGVLNREIEAILAQAATRKTLQAQGFETAGGTPEAFARFLQAEIAKWGEVVRASGARLD